LDLPGWRQSGGYGLGLEVDGPNKPGLRAEVCAGGRLLLRQAGTPVFLAAVRSDYWRFRYARTAMYRPVLPPLRAVEVRRLGVNSGTGSWYLRWAHRFASLLESAPSSPLHAGRWALRAEPEEIATDEAQASEEWAPLLTPAAAGEVDLWVRGRAPC
jgi:hypothetical protein